MAKTGEQIRQFIEYCYIPNNTHISKYQLPDIWQDYIDGKLTLNENLSKIEELVQKVQTSEQKWDNFDHESYYAKYQHWLEKHTFKNQ